MKILVYEHASGGGYAEQTMPSGVLAEGFAMLRCVVADFRASGHEVTVLLDTRLAKFNFSIGANYTKQIVYADEPEKFFSSAATRNDAVYVIAPETGLTLQNFIMLTEKTGKTSLNSESNAVAEVADKSVLYENLKKRGLSTPKTVVLNINDNLVDIEQAIKHELVYPIILKPVDGTGCSGISLVKESQGIQRAVAKIKTQSPHTRFIAQEYIEGDPASVSLIANGTKAAAISLNKQNINLAESAETSNYFGGYVPFQHPLIQEAYGLAEKTVGSFSGLRGFVGVDLIVGKEKLFVLDVNARLTTSYVGLRQAADFNVAEAIVDSVLKGSLPQKNRLHGIACFSKVLTAKPAIGAYHRASKLRGIITPPFPLAGSTDASSLIMGYGDNLQDAQLRLEEAKKQLLNIIR